MSDDLTRGVVLEALQQTLGSFTYVPREGGPKTPEGIERIRRARLTHGRYSQGAVTECGDCLALIRNLRELMRLAT